jgi:hypothetical protein
MGRLAQFLLSKCDCNLKTFPMQTLDVLVLTDIDTPSYYKYIRILQAIEFVKKIKYDSKRSVYILNPKFLNSDNKTLNLSKLEEKIIAFLYLAKHN